MTPAAILFAAWAILSTIGALLVLTAPHGWEDERGFWLGREDDQ